MLLTLIGRWKSYVVHAGDPELRWPGCGIVDLVGEGILAFNDAAVCTPLADLATRENGCAIS